MAQALRLARRGLYTTHPNPRVGCVLVRDGAVVGEGWHQRAGEPHAEVLALRQAGDKARGATAYVTLEPCAHHGRTPPCCDALIAAGVARVVSAVEDPNPQVDGGGHRRLEAAGIAVAIGCLEAEARALNCGFIKRMRAGRPWVRCKLAMSLDGRTAMASGESRWITGDDARRDVHRWRAQSSAVVTGSGTLRADDPSLTVRDVEGADTLPQPARVVLDSRLRMRATAGMLALPGRTIVLGATDAPDRPDLADAGAEVIRVAAADSGLELGAVLDTLGALEFNEVLVEAGPTLCGALVRQGLADELIFYVAPHLMGHQGRPLFALPGLEHMNQRLPLEIFETRSIGADLRLRARIAASG